MEPTFYIASAIAVISTIVMLSRLNLVHALLYLIVSLLGVAVDFFLLGAPFAAALEAIVYAGAIMVLFLFVVMMLNIGKHAAETEKEWLSPGIWTGPAILSATLLIEVVNLTRGASAGLGGVSIGPKQVGIALYGPYAIGAGLASMLLLSGLVGAYHLGFRRNEKPEIKYDADTHERRVDTSGDLVLAGTDRSARTT
jgi:NADH-quinone oxidoreductase subunit J